MNRIATEGDKAIYGEYITPGDLIIDTPTKNKDVIYYFMASQWPTIREGATIWFDGLKLGKLDTIKLQCTAQEATTPWTIQTANIRHIPHTQLVFESFNCFGLKNLWIDGYSEQLPGMTSWESDKKFLSGSFGIHVIGSVMGGHGINVSVLDGGNLTINSIEGQHGFDILRLFPHSTPVTINSLTITNTYIHDTGDGEGMYIGSTQLYPFALIKNLRINNVIIARAAAESLQLQHLIGNAEVSYVTIFAGNTKWQHEFKAGQDTGIQWNMDGGSNHIHHIILDGFGSVGLVPFGSTQGTGEKHSKVEDILFNDGRGTGLYLHNSMSIGATWEFNNLTFSNFNNLYYDRTGESKKDYIVGFDKFTDAVSFSNLVHDGSKSKVLVKPSPLISCGEVTQRPVEKLQYRNSGFHEPASSIKQWHQYFGGYFPASVPTNGHQTAYVATHWFVNDIAIYADEVNQTWQFYKCLVEHDATEITPSDNHSAFTRLTWDINAVRSDQPRWNSGSIQRDLPPDDLRLMPGNPWNHYGIKLNAEILETTVENGEMSIKTSQGTFKVPLTIV